MTIYKQGQLVVYRNDKKDEIIIMINDKGYEGIVLHSDGLVSSGTTIKIDDSYEPYVGTLTLTVAAAEAAIGLAIIVVYYRSSGTIRVEEIDKLKG